MFEIVRSENEQLANATIYLATKMQIGLKPYDWYLALLIAGSIECGIEPAQLDALKAVQFDTDTCVERKTRQDAIRALCIAGHPNLNSLLPVG